MGGANAFERQRECVRGAVQTRSGVAHMHSRDSVNAFEGRRKILKWSNAGKERRKNEGGRGHLKWVRFETGEKTRLVL